MDKEKLNLPDISQVGIVVGDLDKAMEYYSSKFGIGPFKVLVPEFHDKTYYGKPADFQIKLAFAKWGYLEIELIQPLRGRNIYSDFLEKNPQGGLHHLCLQVEDLEKTISEFDKVGIKVIQGGRVEGGGHAYLETEGLLGFTLELGKNPPGWPPVEDKT